MWLEALHTQATFQKVLGIFDHVTSTRVFYWQDTKLMTPQHCVHSSTSTINRGQYPKINLVERVWRRIRDTTEREREEEMKEIMLQKILAGYTERDSNDRRTLAVTVCWNGVWEIWVDKTTKQTKQVMDSCRTSQWLKKCDASRWVSCWKRKILSAEVHIR